MSLNRGQTSSMHIIAKVYRTNSGQVYTVCILSKERNLTSHSKTSRMKSIIKPRSLFNDTRFVWRKIWKWLSLIQFEIVTPMSSNRDHGFTIMRFCSQIQCDITNLTIRNVIIFLCHFLHLKNKWWLPVFYWL